MHDMHHTGGLTPADVYASIYPDAQTSLENLQAFLVAHAPSATATWQDCQFLEELIATLMDLEHVCDAAPTAFRCSVYDPRTRQYLPHEGV
jgi:hypothetical protein